ncbi:hypothetical protein, partial [Pseudomonas sp. FIP_A4]|uniref:hypothetical protein n=1 Tax=Pseudomonas sp. FIP_A4 TaxID=3070684 RepID=UPI003FA6E295
FERDGYLVIPNLFSAAEVALFRAAVGFLDGLAGVGDGRIPAHALEFGAKKRHLRGTEQIGDDQVAVALEAMVRQYPKPDLSHVDYRVHACKQAEHALGNYRAALATSPAA